MQMYELLCFYFEKNLRRKVLIYNTTTLLHSHIKTTNKHQKHIN